MHGTPVQYTGERVHCGGCLLFAQNQSKDLTLYFDLATICELLPQLVIYTLRRFVFEYQLLHCMADSASLLSSFFQPAVSRYPWWYSATRRRGSMPRPPPRKTGTTHTVTSSASGTGAASRTRHRPPPVQVRYSRLNRRGHAHRLTIPPTYKGGNAYKLLSQRPSEIKCSL